MNSEIQSPFILIKRLEADVLRLLSHIDITDLDSVQQRTLIQLKNEMTDARLDVQDYELAETREHQLRNAKDAIRRLAHVQKAISDNDLHVFGAVDVAHLLAQIGQVTDRLK